MWHAGGNKRKHIKVQLSFLLLFIDGGHQHL